MKQSGVSWLGEIPDHWEVAPLKTAFSRVRRPALANAGIVTAFRDGEVTLRSNRRSEGYTEADDYSGYQRILPNDLAIHSMDAFAGAIGVSDSDGICSPVLSVCVAKNGNNPRYMAYQLRFMSKRGWIEALSRSVRERTSEFRWAEAGSQKVALPPVEEQSAIAHFLDSELKTLDSVKASQEKLIELLIERRLAAIQSEIQASANLPDSIISPLKWHAKLRTGGTPANAQYSAETADGVPWLRPDDLDELGNPSRGTRFFDKSSLTGIAMAVPGSILLCCIGATLGKAGIVLENVAFNQQITSITSPLNSRYLHYYLVAKRQELKNLSMGNTLPILNNDRLGTLQIVIPTAENQARIVHQLDVLTSSMDTAIQKSRELITALTERRQALINDAVTGKIDIRGKN